MQCRPPTGQWHCSATVEETLGPRVMPFNSCSMSDDRCGTGYACARTGERTLCMPSADTVKRSQHSPVFANMLRHAVGAV